MPTPLATTHHAPGFTRRHMLATAAALPWVASPTAWAQDKPLRLGQSTALTGPLGELGLAMQQGAKAAFHHANALGGIHGRTIELVSLDDGYDAARAVANVDKLLADPEVFALFNCMGTPMIEAMLPKVRAAGLPFFAPFTGALVTRIADARAIFNIRASYTEEAERLVEHLGAIKIQRIAVVYQNNAFGREFYGAAQQAMQALKMPNPPLATVDNDAANAAAAAAQLAEANPDAVLIGLAGKPTLEFIRAFRALRRGTPLYALSVMGTASTLAALGDDARGMAITQVVPLPGNTVLPVVRAFQQAWTASGGKGEPSHLALEGYINARVFCEALQRAGRNPTRAAFIDATWGIKRWDLGGFVVNATTPERNASRFVELTMVGRGGRFVR